MFKNFKSGFNEYSTVVNTPIELKSIPFKYSELLLEFGGKSYDNGLYTIHTFKDSIMWTNQLFRYFEKYNDWMGRQFCVPTRSNECILIFDPATQEDLYIDVDLIYFHEYILPVDKIDLLASDLFEVGVDI